MKSAIFRALFLIFFVLFSLEIILTTAWPYYYRIRNDETRGGDFFTTVLIAKKILGRLNLTQTNIKPYEFGQEGNPPDFFKEDESFGWVSKSGRYYQTYKKRKRGARDWKKLVIKATLNPDGSRWTGKDFNPELPTVYILGDSFVYGAGVHDEMTFSYHLQTALPGWNIKLFALPGYSLSHTYIRFQLLKDQIKETDIILIGYADYFDVRNVVAPSRLREVDAWLTKNNLGKVKEKIPQANLSDDGKIHFQLVSQSCENTDYCQRPDPPRDAMARVSAALINGIAAQTKAKVYILYFEGKGIQKNPVFSKLDPKIKVLSVTSGDLKDFIRDDIDGFDPHPGPYWHYLISRKILESGVAGQSDESF